MIFRTESLGEAFIDMLPLINEHWYEVGMERDMPPDPDLTTYEHLEKGKCLKVYTARSDDGELIGYCVMFVMPDIHYKDNIKASCDMLYLLPEYRGNGLRFLEFVEKDLLESRVKIVYHSVRPQKDYSKSLLAIGYRFEEKLYSKRLDMEV